MRGSGLPLKTSRAIATFAPRAISTCARPAATKIRTVSHNTPYKECYGSHLFLMDQKKECACGHYAQEEAGGRHVPPYVGLRVLDAPCTVTGSLAPPITNNQGLLRTDGDEEDEHCNIAEDGEAVTDRVEVDPDGVIRREFGHQGEMVHLHSCPTAGAYTSHQQVAAAGGGRGHAHPKLNRAAHTE